MHSENDNEDHPVEVPFWDDSQQMADLRYRIERILRHPNVPEEFKESFRENNFIQLFNQLDAQQQEAK